MLYNIILVALVTVSVVLIGLILIQHGKGAEAGAAFGGGASGTVFGSEGSGSFLTKATGILAALFFILSLSLAYIAAQQSKQATATEDEFAPAIQQQQVESDIPIAETAEESTTVSDVPVAEVPVSEETPSVPKTEK